MTVYTEAMPASRSRTARWVAPGICLAGAALSIAVVPVMGFGLYSSSSTQVTDLLAERAARGSLSAVMAVFAAAALAFAAARLARRLGGTAGLVAMGSGTGVAFLLAAYYASFGAGTIVATQMLDNPGPGLGEATLAMANMVELTRYAPSLVVLAVALAARRSLPKPVVIGAGVLLAITLFPITTWVAAILVPFWLGVAGATVPARS